MASFFEGGPHQNSQAKKVHGHPAETHATSTALGNIADASEGLRILLSCRNSLSQLGSCGVRLLASHHVPLETGGLRVGFPFSQKKEAVSSKTTPPTPTFPARRYGWCPKASWLSGATGGKQSPCNHSQCLQVSWTELVPPTSKQAQNRGQPRGHCFKFARSLHGWHAMPPRQSMIKLRGSLTGA